MKLTRRAAVAGLLAAPHIARAAGPIVLRWSDVAAPTHPAVISAERAAKEVRESTSGRVEIQVFGSGQLGGSRDTVEAVSSGAQQIVTEGAGIIGQFLPQVTIIEAPYVWRDAAHMARAMASTAVEDLNTQLIAKRDMRILCATYYGKRHLTTGKREVHTAADMAGFKLRVPEVDTYTAMAEAWGARPTPLNFGELYLALSQGVVDGQENPLPTIQSGKFFEVQKFLVLTGHIITPRLVMVNETTWKTLSAADQAATLAAIKSASAWNDAEIARQEATLADTFKAQGMTVIQPDLESFRKPVLATVPAKFESKWGKGFWNKLQAL